MLFMRARVGWSSCDPQTRCRECMSLSNRISSKGLVSRTCGNQADTQTETRAILKSFVVMHNVCRSQTRVVEEASSLFIRNDGQPRVPRGPSPPNYFLFSPLLFRICICGDSLQELQSQIGNQSYVNVRTFRATIQKMAAGLLVGR